MAYSRLAYRAVIILQVPRALLQCLVVIRMRSERIVLDDISLWSNVISNVVVAANVCRDDQFQCESLGRCVGDYLVCNGYDDCGDLSDEQHCSQ